MLNQPVECVHPDAVARGVVRRGDQDHLRMMPVNLVDDLLQVVHEEAAALLHRVVDLGAEDLLCHGFVVPPRLVGEEDGFPLLKVTVDRLLEHVLAPVA